MAQDIAQGVDWLPIICIQTSPTAAVFHADQSFVSFSETSHVPQQAEVWHTCVAWCANLGDWQAVIFMFAVAKITNLQQWTPRRVQKGVLQLDVAIEDPHLQAVNLGLDSAF